MRVFADSAAGSAAQHSRQSRWVEIPGLLLLTCVMTAVYLAAYKQHPAHPHIGGDLGWLNWFDQSWYYSGAKGWASGNLDPKLHLYLPGYSLLAAVFLPLLSVHAFLAVDLLCLLASLWLFSRLATRLAPRDVPQPALINVGWRRTVTAGVSTAAHWVSTISAASISSICRGCRNIRAPIVPTPSPRPWRG
jgi:hypothetical protein